jgi:hypothetical protein
MVFNGLIWQYFNAVNKDLTTQQENQRIGIPTVFRYWLRDMRFLIDYLMDSKDAEFELLV